jgi:predicted nucleic acid-binding protein
VIVADTNLLSELSRSDRDQNVLGWMAEWNDQTFVPTIAIAEMRYGCEKLSPSRKRAALEGWLADLIVLYSPRILPFDLAAAEAHGILRARLERLGKPMNAADSMIAATALAHGAPVATRNVRDFGACGVEVVNPWEA